MANLKQSCPQCNAFALKCTRTTPVQYGEHELESARVSYWKCSICDAHFELSIPMGKLRIIKKGQLKNNILDKVLKTLSPI